MNEYILNYDVAWLKVSLEIFQLYLLHPESE